MQNPVIFLVVADDVFTLLMMPNSCVPRDRLYPSIWASHVIMISSKGDVTDEQERSWR